MDPVYTPTLKGATMAFSPKHEKKVLLECSKILKHKDFGSYASETGLNSREAFISIVNLLDGDVRGICSLCSLHSFDPLSVFGVVSHGIMPRDIVMRDPDYNDSSIAIQSIMLLYSLQKELPRRATLSKGNALAIHHAKAIGGIEQGKAVNFGPIVSEINGDPLIFGAKLGAHIDSFLNPRLTMSACFNVSSPKPTRDLFAIFDVISRLRVLPVHPESTTPVKRYASLLFPMSMEAWETKADLLDALKEKDPASICSLIRMYDQLSDRQLVLYRNALCGAYTFAKRHHPRNKVMLSAFESALSGKVERAPKREKGALPIDALKKHFHIKLKDGEKYAGRWLRVKTTGPFTKNTLTLSTFQTGYENPISDYVVRFDQISESLNSRLKTAKFCKHCGCLDSGYSNLAVRWLPNCQNHEFEAFDETNF